MRVLVACEFSGVVREAFGARGHEAWSCDLLASERPGNHIQGDVFEHLEDGWDLLLFFYPCTNLCVSGARWFKGKLDAQERDLEAFRRLDRSVIPKSCGENPIGILSTRYRAPDQIIQPWQFGHGETKATCLWLKGLPPLQPTHLEGDFFCAEAPVERKARVHHEAPSPDRWKNRSRTYLGIARAMAEQWG